MQSVFLLKRSWAVGKAIVVLTAAIGVSWATAPGAQEGDAPAAEEKAATPSPMETKREEINRALARLKAEDAQQAAAFAAELASVEANVDEYLDAADSDLEFHAVSVGEGGLLPAGLVEGKDRFTLRYAEVQVTRTGRPLVLVLRTSSPMYWKISPAEGVRIDAVLVDGHAQQRVVGVADETWVVPPSALGAEGSLWTKDLLTPDERPWDWNAKDGRRDVRTLLAFDEYPGEKIIVGRENPAWREQYVMGHLRALANRVIRASEELAAKKNVARLEKLTFEAKSLSQNRGNAAIASILALSF
ncbi:MAG: hypothetical protein WD875_02455 [Pirellulales bacterium]